MGSLPIQRLNAVIKRIYPNLLASRVTLIFETIVTVSIDENNVITRTDVHRVVKPVNLILIPTHTHNLLSSEVIASYLFQTSVRSEQPIGIYFWYLYSDLDAYILLTNRALIKAGVLTPKHTESESKTLSHSVG